MGRYILPVLVGIAGYTLAGYLMPLTNPLVVAVSAGIGALVVSLAQLGSSGFGRRF